MKLTVSGWPGAGSTTLALILCDLLNLKFYSGGETFRFLGSKLDYSDTGEDRIDADKMLEEDFGKIYDKYVDTILLDNSIDNILVESDIAAFRIGKSEAFFSIFLTCDLESRTRRLTSDNRKEDSFIITKRDKENQEFYKTLHGIDWLDINEINQKHSLVINNSELPIATEINLILDKLKLNIIEEAKLKELEELYWKKGKSHFKDLLKQKSLIATSEEILSNIKKSFPAEVDALPEKLKAVINAVT